MVTIDLETEIAAPLERCFLLSLSIDLHKDSAAGTRERAVAGVTEGIIGAGQSVTWRGRHFGLSLRHTTIIDAYSRPFHFRDTMTQGLFRSFAHDHYFSVMPDGGTLMRDHLRFSAPLAFLGRMAEVIALQPHLRQFLRERNEVIRTVAEGPANVWQRYLEGAHGPL